MAFRTIGVVAALAQEADALFAGQGEVNAAHRMTIRAVACGGLRVMIATSGIGKVNAAMAATLLASVYGAQLLMVVGTAGRVAAAPGSAYWLYDAIQHDYGAQRSSGFVTYSAGAWPIGEAELHPLIATPDPDSGLPPVRIVSGDAFIECPLGAARLAGPLGAVLVDMESAAVAQVAATFGLPWGGVKAVTDDADGNSAGSFQDNLLRAAKEAARACEAAIAALAGTAGS